MTTGNEGVPTNGNHKHKKTKRAAKANVVTARRSPVLDAQALTTTDITCRSKPKNIALGPVQKLNLANDSNTLHTDTLHMDNVLVLFTRRYCDSVILSLQSSFKFYLCATLTVLYSQPAVSIMLSLC